MSIWSTKLRSIRVTFLYLFEDEAAAVCISSKNSQESYVYNLCNNKNLKNKFDAVDKEKLEGAVNETISWFDASQKALKDEYDEMSFCHGLWLN